MVESKWKQMMQEWILGDAHEATYEPDETYPGNGIFDWNPRVTTKQIPPETELIPIGTYDGVDLPGCCVLDDSYVVYAEALAPELNCKMEINMKVMVICEMCEKEILVDFILPPTDEDKAGWYCDDCCTDVTVFEEEIDKS